MSDVAEAISTERLALLELLETLTADQWATPSLCTGWSVQDVAAHLAWVPALTAGRGLLELARAGGRANRMVADSARRWSTRGPAAILAQLRVVARDGSKPPAVPLAAVVVDAVLHQIDIRRPLDRPRPVDPTAFAVAADFCADARWPSSALLGGRRARPVSGLRLVATDQSWSHGDGLEVRAPGAALLLLLGGRPVRPGELEGPGAATLQTRLSAARDPGRL